MLLILAVLKASRRQTWTAGRTVLIMVSGTWHLTGEYVVQKMI